MTALNFTYAVFGLLLRSNLPIPEMIPLQPELIPSPPDAAGDNAVAVHLNASPTTSALNPSGPEELSYANSYKDEAGEPTLKIWKAVGSRYLRLAYFDGSQFWLDREGTEVWATWPANLTLEDAATYLLGPVLGLLLRLRGVTCLHASAVAFGENAVAFVGSEGAGKSTTAAALARRGHAILSDDVVALAERNGSFFIHPAYPYLCLWPESVESLYGSAEALPQFSANYEKRCLSLGKQELQFAQQALPLAAIYILGERRGDPAPLAEDLTPQRAFLALVANTFATNTLDSDMRAKEFEILARVTPSVPIRLLCAHHDASRLSDLCDLLSKEAQTLDTWKPARA
ncbi:MAG TPA: hypothetical protein VN902_07905 [Candidatus Acidoferrales bacterium]|nr:hypothetical protein [Candidatus Acidoferrales bacterium]